MGNLTGVNNKMTNQQILDNAPEWATCYNQYSGYDAKSTRSIADIRRIVELESAISDAMTTINQLQGDYDD